MADQASIYDQELKDKLSAPLSTGHQSFHAVTDSVSILTEMKTHRGQDIEAGIPPARWRPPRFFPREADQGQDNAGCRKD